MKNNQMIGMMTVHTSSMLLGDYIFNSSIKEISNPAEIREFVMRKFKGQFATVENEQNFIKGLALCNFDAIFDKICKNRGFYIAVENLMVDLINEIKTLPVILKEETIQEESDTFEEWMKEEDKKALDME